MNYEDSFKKHCQDYEIGFEIVEKIYEAGGRAYFVGGCVRDTLLGINSHEIDIESYGLPITDLQKALKPKFEAHCVGKSFGVLKLKGVPIDISIPRMEKKTGPLHKDFGIKIDPNLSILSACERRDFTINSILWDPLVRKLIDPLNGIEDLKNRILRHTTEKFSEDPLRVLRAMQLIARFDLRVDPETLELCKEQSIEKISPERIFEEWKKLICQGIVISKGLEFLKVCNWIQYFPELKNLHNCPQNPKWHPEGDVWQHTKHCMDAFARQRGSMDKQEALVIGFSVLCHDFGKPKKTIIQIDGKITSKGHEKASVPLTKSFLGRMTEEKKLIESILPLVEYHMIPPQFYRDQSSDVAIRRLSLKVSRIDRLIKVAQCDQLGRPPTKPDVESFSIWLSSKAKKLKIQQQGLDPILMGRHLIEMGLKPDKRFKKLLESSYEAQIEGSISTLEQAKDFIKNLDVYTQLKQSQSF